jgi:hypothetical protein
MVIERTKDEVVIRLSASIDTDDLQNFLNYIRYKELTSTFKVSQKEVDELSTEIKSSWWNANKDKLS